jgi:hypothetical protein
MRRTLLVAVVLVLALVALDRGAELLAERVAADQTRSRLSLPSTPDVEVGGFPFLTQVVTGHMDEVHVTLAGAPLGRLTADRVVVTAHDLDVDRRMPLESYAGRVRARVVLGYPEVSRLAPEDVEVGAHEDGGLRVAASLGGVRPLDVVAHSALRWEDGAFSVVASEVTANGAPLAPALAPRVKGRLDFAVPVRGLPDGVRVVSVAARQDGLHVVGEGRDLALARVVAALR